MVDALASGASVRMDVEVRVLSWAPILRNIDTLKDPFSWTFLRFGDRLLTIAERSIPPMALTDLKISKAKTEAKPYKLSDGGGLFVLM